MDAPTAAAIGSFCTLALGLVTLGVNLILAERVRETHNAVNSKAAELQALVSKSSFAEGVQAASDPSGAGVLTKPPGSTPPTALE
jgi:hypothetical protein